MSAHAQPLLDLPDVTLCAVAGNLIPESLAAIARSQRCARFGDALFVTDRTAQFVSPPGLRIERVAKLDSRIAYSQVVQTGLAALIRTPFVLIVQWDGYPVRSECWHDAFLDYDYIGAPWPQFSADRAVGNGGFSLRSRRLLNACRDPRFVPSHPEDVGICHDNRPLLESEFGLRFAPLALAQRFAYERMGDPAQTFGFHGLFNMPREMGLPDFLRFFEAVDMAQIGVRELCDLSEQLLRSRDVAARAAARRIFAQLRRAHWRDPALWRHVRRKLTGRLIIDPVPVGAR